MGTASSEGFSSECARDLFRGRNPPTRRQRGAAGKQQVPPLRRRWRSDSGRNDKI